MRSPRPLSALALAFSCLSPVACGDGAGPLNDADSLRVTRILFAPLSGRVHALAYDVNDEVLLVGASWGAPETFQRATRWTLSGEPADQGAPGDPTSGPGTIAHAVNRFGVVVGYTWLGGEPSAETDVRAIRWSAAGVVDTLGPGYAYDVNDAGQVAGCIWVPGTPMVLRATIWSADGRAQDIGTLGGPHSCAWAINDSGWVAGRASTGPPGVQHAFLWKPDAGMTDIGTLGGSTSWAFGINNRGEVVGQSVLDGPGDPSAGDPEAPFLWTEKDGMVALPLLGVAANGRGHAVAYDINDAGDIVGVSSTSAQPQHATLWPAGSRVPVDLTELTDPYYGLARAALAFAISPSGLIVGSDRYRGFGGDAPGPASPALWRLEMRR